MSRRSASSSGGRTVQVSGYTRSNGTYVAGYTRSAPGSGSSASSSSGSTVQVSGYTRSNGTYVAGYTRSLPSTSNSSSQRCYVDNAANRELGRVGKPLGTHVVHSDGSTTVSGIRKRTEHPVQVSGYTRSDGTNVAGYTRSLPGTSSSQQHYVDNAYNRK